MRVAPLTGLLAVALTVVAFLLFGDTPDVDARGGEVRSYYDDHRAQTAVSLYLLVLASVFFVLFAAHLAQVVRAVPGGDWLHRAVVAGGVLIAVGFLVGASLSLALVDLSDKEAAADASLQTLNALSEDFFIPFVGGMGLMLLAAGLATVRAAAGPWPRWLSWAAVALGVLVFVPWVGFFAFMLAGLWVAAVSVLLARRPSAAPASAPGPAPEGTS
ncbi:hypothetical protein [Streptomyces lincolnensis]|uniref:hypothetical protein n=1 Tax=Streptomyces lincolnensis TaxID=1915 RepID=UPI000829FFE9|nr:hypothetical protein [Streptomyces lincolnensis]QMV06173.1 hypothetical protein GJU35_11230 [Streptomyces lincolnensis]